MLENDRDNSTTMAKKDKKDKKDKKKKSKEKKPKKDKKEKKSKTSDPPSPTGASPATKQPTDTATTFSAGQLFERYSRGGGSLGRNDFQRLVEAEQLRPQPSPSALSRNPEDDFEVGRLFERFSQNTPGHLTQEEFGNVLRTMNDGNRYRNTNPRQHFPPQNNAPTSYASTMASANSATGAIVNSPHPQLPRALGELRNNYNNASNRSLPLASTELHILSMNLMSKRDQLLQQMRHVQARTEEVQSVRRAIERETIADTEAILHRLRSVEAFKLSLLNHDMTQLQHDIDEIDSFSNEMHGVDGGSGGSSLSGISKGSSSSSSSSSSRSSSSNPYGAMHSLSSTGATTARGRYLETCAEGERIVQKPYKATTEVHADDYDREIADRLAMGREFHAMEEALEQKNDMVRDLMLEQEQYKNREMELTAKIELFSQKSKDEMEEWVKLCKSLKKQVTRLNNGGLRSDSADEIEMNIDDNVVRVVR